MAFKNLDKKLLHCGTTLSYMFRMFRELFRTCYVNVPAKFPTIFPQIPHNMDCSACSESCSVMLRTCSVYFIYVTLLQVMTRDISCPYIKAGHPCPHIQFPFCHRQDNTLGAPPSCTPSSCCSLLDVNAAIGKATAWGTNAKNGENTQEEGTF